MDVPAQCWLHPSISIRRSLLGGCGWFARSALHDREAVATFGGRVVSDAELAVLFDESATYVDTITIAEGRNLVLPPGTSLHYGNHSCDPNTWWSDAVTLVARRPIRADEEITTDYAMATADPAWRMDCSCASPLCRGVITGGDWQRPELQRRYGRHWVPELLRRIESRQR
jgi:uncharacterized protein